MARKEEKPSYKHYKKEGHDEDHCWQLHPERRPKWFKEKKEKPSCKHCKKEGHDEDHCWKLHPKKRPKWFKERKGRQTVAATTRPTYLGSDSGDESKVSLVGMTDKIG